MKQIYLENTTGSHNKFYQMTELVNSSAQLPEFEATWGAIGSTNSRTKRYSMSDWDRILNSKLAKGYVQVSLDDEIKDFEKDEKWWNIKEKLEKLNQRVAGYKSYIGFDTPEEERAWDTDRDNIVAIYQVFFNTGKIEKAHLKFANKLWKKYEQV